MKIAALRLKEASNWPGICADGLDAGLNVFHGPPASGKTALADLIGHALCGQRIGASGATESGALAEGELIVESAGQRFRLRRQQDNSPAGRLTVAGVDGTASVDRDTVHRLVYGLSPTLLAPLCVLNFREPLRPERLLSGRFAWEFRRAFPRMGWDGNRPASSFLAQLTGGDLRRLLVLRRKRRMVVLDRAAQVLTPNSLSPAERDLAYLSVCLALVSALRRHGIELPLVLDEPFGRLDRRATIALADVVQELGRGGQQVLLFTAQQEAASRFAEHGIAVHEMPQLCGRPAEAAFTVVRQAKPQAVRPNTKRRRRRAG